jgi:hypothetical protein
MASYAWWKMWFQDEQSVLSSLMAFTGKISFNNGDIDSQTPGKRELPLVEAQQQSMSGPVRINLYSGLGHGFGPEPLMGPIDLSAKERLLEEVRWLLR